MLAWILTAIHRVDYNREHLEHNSKLLFLTRDSAPVPVQPVTNWLHYRAANVLGMGAETLPMQKYVEELANRPCRAICCRTNNGELFAGLELPKVSSGTIIIFYLPSGECVLIKAHM